MKKVTLTTELYIDISSKRAPIYTTIRKTSKHETLESVLKRELTLPELSRAPEYEVDTNALINGRYAECITRKPPKDNRASAEQQAQRVKITIEYI